MRISKESSQRFPLIAAVIALTTMMLGYVSFARAIDLSRLMGFGNDDPTLETFSIIHVADLKAMMNDTRSPVHIYDANVASTRAHYGVIPGATLLTSDDKYDLSVLPQDKKSKLVFYCANSLWTASHEAARRAVKAGYQNVSVMADGIRGWAQAGQPTTLVSTTEGRAS